MSRMVEKRCDGTPGSESRFPSDPSRDRSSSVLKTRAQPVRQHPTLRSLGDLAQTRDDTNRVAGAVPG